MKTKTMQQSIRDFIRSKSIELANCPFIAETKGEELAPNEIADMLEATFNNFMLEQGEIDIIQLEKKNKKLNQSISDRENEITKLKQKFRHHYREITNETAAMQKELQKLQDNMKHTEDHADQKLYNAKEKRRMKEIKMEQLLNVLDECQAKEKMLSSEMQSLREFINYFHDGTNKMLTQYGKIWNGKARNVIAKFKSNKEAMMSSIQDNLQSKIITEQQQQTKMNSIASSIVEAVQSLDQDREIGVNVDIFEAQISDIILFLDSALRKTEVTTRQKIFDQVHDMFPEFVANVQDPDEAFKIFIESASQKKEEEYNALLMHRQEKERQLNEQLQVALAKIKELQESVSSLEAADSTDSIDVGDWESNKKVLDQKIDQLKQFQTESSSIHSELIVSPFH